MCLRCFGGAKGSRTPDLLNAIQTRYQLRYNPKIFIEILMSFQIFGIALTLCSRNCSKA